MTAKLQTAKEVAKRAGISERQLFKGGEIVRRGRSDLLDKVVAGEMSMHAAYLEARGESRPTSWDRLVTAWNNATPAERARLIEQVTGDGSYARAVAEQTAICLPAGTANLQLWHRPQILREEPAASMTYPTKLNGRMAS